MLPQKNLFIYSPGDENEGGDIMENSDDDSKTGDQLSSESKQKPSIFKKIKDALQDWSNSDQAEQKFDDTRP